MGLWPEVRGSTSHVNCPVGEKCELRTGPGGLPSLICSKSVEEILVWRSPLACPVTTTVALGRRVEVLHLAICQRWAERPSLFHLLSIFPSSKCNESPKVTLPPFVTSLQEAGAW